MLKGFKQGILNAVALLRVIFKQNDTMYHLLSSKIEPCATPDLFISEMLEKQTTSKQNKLLMHSLALSIIEEGI